MRCPQITGRLLDLYATFIDLKTHLAQGQKWTFPRSPYNISEILFKFDIGGFYEMSENSDF